MYEQYYELRERPFDLVPDPRFLVLTEAHAEALSTLEYAISSRKGVTVLTGEAGLGKTTLLRTAIDKQPERVHCVYIQNPALSREEFVELLARRFGLSKDACSSKTTLLVELEELLQQTRNRGEMTLLVIDEGQSLPLELLEEVRLLANIETTNDRLLSLIIAGQPELAERLNDPRLRQFKQRVALRCELRPLTLDETLAYVAGRLAAAGGVGAQVLTREAVEEIHRHSGGIPRTISVIADNALLGGYAAGQKPVRASTVRDVCRDLDLPELARPAESRDLRPFAPEATTGNGHRKEMPELPDAGGSRMLRARVSVPGESDESESDMPAVAAAASDRPMFGTFMKKRRFFFFGR